MNRRFNWSDFKEKADLINNSLKNKFSDYFNLTGNYSGNIVMLANDISKLTKSELSLLLKLRRFPDNKTLVEIIIEVLEKTDPRARTLYLQLIYFIIKNDTDSRMFFLKHLSKIRPFIDIQDTEVKNLANQILRNLEPNSGALNEQNQTKVRNNPQIEGITNNYNESGPMTIVTVNQTINSKSDSNAPSKEKPWLYRYQYIIPIVAAIIGGIFLLSQNLISKKVNQQNPNMGTYELVFIDQMTLKTPIFDTINPKVRLYYKTPPEIITIVKGALKFDFNKDLSSEPILIEFDNINNFDLVDRKQLLKVGRNDILVRRKK